uniref:Uncharacterized protein n=1 Tax=Pipistrellus kuhlii TaxID=59472 RepID=A0A7J8A3A3_PIPKU|nr:hypothetical protein mPipKuh1_000150 [Pipistrellus kuhlii]
MSSSVGTWCWRLQLPGWPFLLHGGANYLLLAPWVAQQEGIMALDVPHTFSLELLSLSSWLDLLIYCFSVPSSPQDSWMLSCHRVGG